MSRFIDTKYVNTIDNLVDATKSKLTNPYYIFGDKNPTKATYYSTNIEKSTLDEASGLYGSHVGEDSPFKYNKVKDFVLYGISQINVDYDVGDYGTESAPITGDAYILPNTINPRPGDFFSIAYIKETLLFKVNGVSTDTLDNGNNFFKIEYSLELTDSIDQIESQTDKIFNFIPTNVGTDFKAIVRDCDFNLVEKLEQAAEELIIYFENVFFNNRLQTFVYNHDGWRMYDPFIIEFFIRNKVFNYGDKYIHIDHATDVDKTFSMDYTKTFFYSLENPDKMVNCQGMATADLIRDINSLFNTVMDDYYKVRYFDTTPYKTRFEVINTDIIDHINKNKLYESGNVNEIYNLWIAYFNKNNEYLNGNMIDLLMNAEYLDNMHYFYTLAISIFIIERYIETLLS